MTKCMKNEVNLKSNAYNPTGQNYFSQLATFNSMSWHLRRILLAKSVVDARNKNYISSKSTQRKSINDKKTYLHLGVTDDVINRLAYDSQYHPMDVLRMNLNSKFIECYDCNLQHGQSRIYGNPECYEKTHRMDRRRQRSTSRSQRTTSPTTACPAKRQKFTPCSMYGKELKNIQKLSHTIDPSTCLQQKKCRYEIDPLFLPRKTAATVDSLTLKSAYHSSTQGEINDHRSMSSTSQSYDDSDCDDRSVKRLASKQRTSQKEEEKKYVKFLYDITKEIMQSGLYTDKELQDVFKKHIDKNKGILNMNKMLYEIYQLKISLNITEDSETDDELEDLIHAQKLLSVSEIRPPTPPKVLDENKVMEKLISYQQLMDTQRKPTNSPGKSVVLVDANPELFVTERDVLISLMEVGIDPKQAQHICKSLLHKSRETGIAETVQTKMDEATSSNSYSNSKLENLQEPGYNEQTSKIIKDACHIPINNNSSADSSTQNEMVEIKEQINSQEMSGDRKLES